MVAHDNKPSESTWHSASTIAKVKALYVVKGVNRNTIADQFKLPVATIATWITRGGWVAERERRLNRLEESSFARANDQDEAFLSSMALQSEELAESGMQVARDAVEEGLSGTRELQQASQSVKNFVDIYFKARKLDRASADISIRADLVFRLPTEEPKNVTPLESSPLASAEPPALPNATA